jgi:hypothetical protein
VECDPFLHWNDWITELERYTRKNRIGHKPEAGFASLGTHTNRAALCRQMRPIEDDTNQDVMNAGCETKFGLVILRIVMSIEV